MSLLWSVVWTPIAIAQPSEEEKLQLVRYALVMEEFSEAEELIARGREMGLDGRYTEEWEVLAQRLSFLRERAYLRALTGAREARRAGDEDGLVGYLAAALRARPEGVEALQMASEWRAEEVALDIRLLKEELHDALDSYNWELVERLLERLVSMVPEEREVLLERYRRRLDEGRELQRVGEIRELWEGVWEVSQRNGVHEWRMTLRVSIDQFGNPRVTIRERGETSFPIFDTGGAQVGRAHQSHEVGVPGDVRFLVGENNWSLPARNYHYDIKIGQLLLLEAGFYSDLGRLQLELQWVPVDWGLAAHNFKVVLEKSGDQSLLWVGEGGLSNWSISPGFWMTTPLARQGPPRIPTWPERLIFQRSRDSFHASRFP